MRLFWKLLAGMLAILMLSFSVFGTILLQSSFRRSLQMEKENGLEEMRLFQYAFLSSADGLTEEALRTLSESIGQNIGDENFTIYDENGVGIYPEGKQAGELYSMLDELDKEDENCAWRVVGTSDGHVMEAMVQMTETYYLGAERNIEYIYENRNRMYRNYRTALLVITAFGTVLAAFFAMAFTRPVNRLSKATREFSGGDYERRVTVKGNDEISALMQDFNSMADRLQTNMEELKEAARRQEEFTGAFAHELKTPLTSMIGYGEMLATMELSDEDRRQAADYIYREGRRLERLSYKLMELIRVGHDTIPPHSVAMEQLGEELQRFAVGMKKSGPISCQVNFADGVIVGDWELLLSLFGNLIDNARKACRQGGKILVTGECEDHGGYRVQVSDNGCGMPEEEINKIVEPFYMIDKSRARQEGGAGLGMAICARIVEAHHARWEITSIEGQGTTVTVFFPAMETMR
jgi:signal transduction histidine kinase